MTTMTLNASKRTFGPAVAKMKVVLRYIVDSIIEARMRRVQSELKARQFDLHPPGDRVSSILNKVQNADRRWQE